jgi:hypothetical protein
MLTVLRVSNWPQMAPGRAQRASARRMARPAAPRRRCCCPPASATGCGIDLKRPWIPPGSDGMSSLFLELVRGKVAPIWRFVLRTFPACTVRQPQPAGTSGGGAAACCPFRRVEAL